VPSNNSFWNAKYDQLVSDAERAVQQALLEEEEESAVEETTNDDVEEEIPPRANNTKVLGMPKIEGAFTKNDPIEAAEKGEIYHWRCSPYSSDIVQT